MLDVIRAGFGRTGTLSPKLALEQLGFDPCYHMSEVAAPRPGHNNGHLDAWVISPSPASRWIGAGSPRATGHREKDQDRSGEKHGIAQAPFWP